MMFSVIIPLYNKVDFCSNTIESVISQSYTDWECIIVDDGSTDGSGVIADSFAASNAKINVIHQKNAGVACARNNGVQNSNGEYVVFLDADDWWSPIFLERMKVLIDNYPNAGIYGVNYYYHKNGKDEVRVHAETGYINYFKTYSSNLQMPLTSISVCIPRKVFDEVGGFPNIKLGEDFLVWAQIALKYKVAFLNEPLVYYNQDVPVALRAVGNLIEPSKHMLWNLGEIEDISLCNKELKQLLDKLRVYGLNPYFRSSKYRYEAECVLEKVDWSQQPFYQFLYFKMPIVILNAMFFVQKIGSFCKQLVKRLLSK